MRCILRYPGAKWASAEKILSYFPSHKSYLEPFFGSGGILFNKEKSKVETVNDIDSEVVNFFNVLKTNYRQLQEMLRYTPYSREVYYNILKASPQNDLEKAYYFFIRSWFGRGGYQRYNSGWSFSTRDAGNKAMIFKNAVDDLEAFVERLREVQIEHLDALKLIKMYDNKDTLIYLDPPYVQGIRKSNLYKHEFSNEEHVKLLELIATLKNAKVLISGYENDLYNNYLVDWNKAVFNSQDEVGAIKQEVVWYNYDKNNQLSLF